MSKPGSPQTTYLAGDDPETIAANRAYQEALTRLTDSLNSRKNRLFDPVLLAAAQGFLAPTQTGSFGESLSNAAAKIGAAESAAFKEQQELDEQRLLLASRGLDVQRQKSLQSMALRQLQGGQAGAPSGDQAVSGQGIQIAPPDPNRMTGEKYYRMAIAQGIPPAEAMKGAAQIDKDNIQVRENGVFYATTGIFYPYKYEEVELQLFGRTYKVPQLTALELSNLARRGDVEGWNKKAREAIRDFSSSAAAQPAAPSAAAQAAAPGAAAQPATLPQQAAAQAAAPVAPAAVPAAVPAAPVLPAAAQAAAVPPVAPQAAVVPPAAAVPPAARPAAPVAAQAAELVGGMFTPPTKNADNPRIGQMVEYYKNNLAVASGLPLNRGQHFSPEVVKQAQEEADATLKRLEENFGMKLAPARPARAQAAPAQAAAQAAPQVQQPVAQPAALAQAAPAAAAAVPSRPAGQAVQSADARLRSREEMEIEQTTAKARAEAEVKSEIENRSQISENAKIAREITATANVFRRMSDQPDFSKMTGILNNDKISSGLAMLVRDGIGGKSISIGVPAIEDVMRNAGLNREQQARFRIFLMYTAKMNLAAENAMKGSTTERERLILGNATISPQDTRETVRIKADLLNLKAQFDKRVANAFEDSKMTPKDFFRSDAYETMYSNYLERLTSIATGEKMLPGPVQQNRPPNRQQSAPGAAARPSGSVQTARDRLSELMARPQGRQ